MNGSSSTPPMNMAAIFGTNTSVISWICVSACRKPMVRPTTSAIASSGPATSTVVHSPSRMISMTSASVILLRIPRRTSPILDRHPHDFLVRRDHLVAHGDGGLQRNFGVVHGHDDVADVDLTGDGLGRFLLALAQGIDPALGRALERVDEAVAAAGGRAAGGRAGAAGRTAGAGDVPVSVDARIHRIDRRHRLFPSAPAAAYERSRSIVRVSMVRAWSIICRLAS